MSYISCTKTFVYCPAGRPRVCEADHMRRWPSGKHQGKAETTIVVWGDAHCWYGPWRRKSRAQFWRTRFIYFWLIIQSSFCLHNLYLCSRLHSWRLGPGSVRLLAWHLLRRRNRSRDSKKWRYYIRFNVIYYFIALSDYLNNRLYDRKVYIWSGNKCVVVRCSHRIVHIGSNWGRHHLGSINDHHDANERCVNYW